MHLGAFHYCELASLINFLDSLDVSMCERDKI